MVTDAERHQWFSVVLTVILFNLSSTCHFALQWNSMPALWLCVLSRFIYIFCTTSLTFSIIRSLKLHYWLRNDFTLVSLIYPSHPFIRRYLLVSSSCCLPKTVKGVIILTRSGTISQLVRRSPSVAYIRPTLKLLLNQLENTGASNYL